jgi:hypothetical protein
MADIAALLSSMDSTPLWVPLVVAAAGVIGTIGAGIGGIVVTQRHADRRDNRTWERVGERERERWAREDESRTFEHRRQSYADFYESLKDMARTAYDHGYGFTEEPELPPDWQSAAFRKLQRLSLYATPTVAEAASRAYNAAWRWGHEIKYDDPDDPRFYELQDVYDTCEVAVLFAMRVDLSIPGGNLTGVP